MKRLMPVLAAAALVAAACSPGGGAGSTTTAVDRVTSSTLGPSSTTSESPPTSLVDRAGYTPVFEKSRCRFEEPPGRDITCGYVVVPEDRALPEGRQVRLAVAIFAAADGAGQPDPIIYLDGGPGGESLDPLQFSFDNVFSPFAEARDLIFFDQRGIGLSEPNLECSEDLELTYDLLDEDLPNSEFLSRQRDALQECHDRLVGSGIDLSQYDSAANASDVNDIRIALGYDEVNLFGISYGTRLAQTVMRDHPTGIRSVILDSVYTPDVDLAASTPANLDRALNVLFAACAGDGECSELYPDLENRLFRLVERLEAAPILVDSIDPLTLDRYQVIVDGSDLLGSVFQGLYSEQIIPVLPQLIDEVEGGTTTTLSQLISIDLANLGFFSLGMHLSVQCAEEVPFSDPAAVAAADDPFPEFVDLFEVSSNIGPEVFGLCEIWGVDPAGPIETEPVVSDIPTLVLAGEFDPITPPAWGELAAVSLSNSNFVLAPGLGHGASLGSDCTTGVALAFVDDPTGPLDTSCIDDLGAPRWAGTASAIVEFELVPLEVDFFGANITAVRPDTWDEIQPGIYGRGSTGVDQTVLIVQAFPTGFEARDLVELFAANINPDGEVEMLEAFAEWSRWRTEFDGFILDLAIQDFGDITALVGLVSTIDERRLLLESVLEPVLDAVRVG